MKKSVQVRNVIIGEGIPKICVSLMGRNKTELVQEIQYLKNLDIDIVEWRMDHYISIEDTENINEIVGVIRRELGEIPLLATFRSKKEGGEKELSNEAYEELNQKVIMSGQVDLVDIELFTGEELAKKLVEIAHLYNVKVVMSNHDFKKTPSKEEIIKRLCKMQELDADLPKIAVMPQTTEDTLCLLTATNEMTTKYANRPIITMAMGKLGLVSRLSGEIFGSALTFGAARIASAPGQIAVSELKQILNIIHSK